jgi:hypothetical protein
MGPDQLPDGDMAKHYSTRLFDLSCQWQLEIPPAWANSYVTVDAALSTSNDRGQAARCFEWSGPFSEEFAAR